MSAKWREEAEEYPESLEAGRFSAQAVRMCADELDAALTQLEGQEGWQPIETAPKDGSLVLLWGDASLTEAAVGWWSGEKNYPWAFIDSTERVEPLCCDHAAEDLVLPNAFSAENGPTHWMPLPSPPAAKEPT